MPSTITEAKTAKWFEVRKQEDQFETGVEFYAKAFDIEEVIAQVKREYVPKHYRSQFNTNANWSGEDQFYTFYTIGRGEGFTISFSISEIDQEDMFDVHRKRDFTE
jgi:hypothetical protein